MHNDGVLKLMNAIHRAVLVLSFGRIGWRAEGMPVVEVSIGGKRRRRYVARHATAQERTDMWPKAVAVYRNYAKYQAKTNREIPMVLLEPAG